MFKLYFCFCVLLLLLFFCKRFAPFHVVHYYYHHHHQWTVLPVTTYQTEFQKFDAQTPLHNADRAGQERPMSRRKVWTTSWTMAICIVIVVVEYTGTHRCTKQRCCFTLLKFTAVVLNKPRTIPNMFRLCVSSDVSNRGNKRTNACYKRADVGL